MNNSISRSEIPSFDFTVLRELRRQANVTLEQMAEETGLSFSTLSRIESNQNQPSLSTLSVLAGYFGLSPANLLDLAGATVVEHLEEDMEDLGDVKRRGVTLPDLKIVLGSAGTGNLTQVPHRHEGFTQIQWVTRGRLVVRIQGQQYELKAGQAIRFDAGLEHVSSFAEETEYIVVLVPKRTR